MKPKLLVLTAGFGEGHNAAARGLAAAFAERQGEGSVRVLDVFAAAAPRWNHLLRRSYLELIHRAPGLWSAAYRWLDRSRWTPALLRTLGRERRLLARVLADERPDLLCSTYPVYGFMLADLARGGVPLPPHWTVVTDSISIHSLWWRGRCDGWCVPNADSAAVLFQAGIDADRMLVTGFPVHPTFERPLAETRPELARGARPRVLYIINSRTAAAAATARHLIAHTDWELTCTVGRNAALQRDLTACAAGRSAPTRILGWTDEIPQLLRTHHVVISKAGGATTQEALAARCPMIVNQIVPGQEEGNYELLRRHGIGAFADTPLGVQRALENAFADRGRVWSEWRQALAPLSRPGAAREIVAHLLDQPDFRRHPAVPAVPVVAGPADHRAGASVA